MDIPTFDAPGGYPQFAQADTSFFFLPLNAESMEYARKPAQVANASPVVLSPVYSSTLSHAIPLSSLQRAR